MKKVFCVSSCLLGLLLSGQLHAEEAIGPEGLSIGVGAQGTVLRVQTDSSNQESRERGRGLDFQIGYGFNENVALYLEIAGAHMVSDHGEGDGLFPDEYAISSGSLGLKLHFPHGAFVPYVDLAVTSITARQEFERGPKVEAIGGGLSAGGGLLLFVRSNLAIDVAIRGTAGAFEEIERTFEENGSSVTSTQELDEGDSTFVYTQARIGLVMYF